MCEGRRNEQKEQLEHAQEQKELLAKENEMQITKAQQKREERERLWGHKEETKLQCVQKYVKFAVKMFTRHEKIADKGEDMLPKSSNFRMFIIEFFR